MNENITIFIEYWYHIIYFSALLTAYKSLKQKNLEMAKTINNKLDEIKELKEKNIHLMSKNMSLTLVNKKQSVSTKNSQIFCFYWYSLFRIL